jgi:hypothetical protein
LSQVLERFEQRVLRRILGVGFVPQNGEGHYVNAALVGPNQWVEQLFFAAQNALDQRVFLFARWSGNRRIGIRRKFQIHFGNILLAAPQQRAWLS